jgi:transcriptional regulator with XRE-family HTH domain
MPTPRPTKPPISDATGRFGARVRGERERLGLSQEGLAEQTSLHWSYIGQVERGQTNLTLHSILRIAAVLQVDPATLVAGLTPPLEQ